MDVILGSDIAESASIFNGEMKLGIPGVDSKINGLLSLLHDGDIIFARGLDATRLFIFRGVKWSISRCGQ